jgi:hypothetical protein
MTAVLTAMSGMDPHMISKPGLGICLVWLVSAGLSFD